MPRPKVKLKIKKKTATVLEGGDNFLGKMLLKAGKITLKTPFGTRKITRVKIAHKLGN